MVVRIVGTVGIVGGRVVTGGGALRQHIPPTQVYVAGHAPTHAEDILFLKKQTSETHVLHIAKQSD